MRTNLALATVLALLAGCAETPIKTAQVPTQHRHVSPAAVAAPELPGDSFDQARGRSQLAVAEAARLAGHPAEARQSAEASIDSWPSDSAAWTELETECRTLKDEPCQNRAGFFLAKIDYLKDLPARAAVLGFQTIAEEPLGTKSGDVVYDQKTIDLARRLWSFYDTQDPMKAMRDQSEEDSFADRNPYAPALLTAGVVAGALTAVKSLAGK
jgi:hypothetical protein